MGLSISIFLFIFVLTTKAKVGSYRYVISLALLVGLLLLSKESYWLSLFLAGVLVAVQHFQQQKQSVLKLSLWQIIIFSAVFFVIVFLIIVPLKLVYPFTQGDWSTRVEEMREIRAWPGFKPSNITRPSYRLAERHEPITIVAINRDWYRDSLKSFYGFFGHFTVVLPTWIYAIAVAVAVSALNVGITIVVAWSKWSLLNLVMKVLLICTPLFIFLNIAASIYNSWTHDFQPQGRYLFPSLIPFAMLLTATVSLENKRIIALRAASWLVSYMLCLHVLINYAM